jgi:RepB plasmid partitioning protein
MEREMETLQRDLKGVTSQYGEDVLELVIAYGFLSKLVRNSAIKRYLARHCAEILAEFNAIIAATSLAQADTSD